MRAQAKLATGAIAAAMTVAIAGTMITPLSALSAAAGHVQVASATDLVAPAGPALNQIDTSSKVAVRQAFLNRYQKNMVRVQQSQGTNLSNCQPGTALANGMAPTIEAWNFLRGLNGLNAVTLDVNSPITKYAMAAAMVSARNQRLSHYPAKDGFACANDDAVRGARHSNLAQSLSQTAAQTALWYYMDYSPAKNPVNDQLGHRLFMMDPQLAKTGMGAVDGFTALSVRTGEGYPGVPASEMENADAKTPEWMSWPSAGFFPRQLLTSVGHTSAGADVERWSFSVLGADLSNATATITDPEGNELPLTVVRPGQPGVNYTPRNIAGYSTLLMKFPTIKHLPTGRENDVYTVKVSGVENTAKSTYTYQVAIFDPMTPLTNSAPTVNLAAQPITGVGYEMTNPIEMNVSGWPMPHLQWQRKENGGEWQDIAGANSNKYQPKRVWKVESDVEYRLVATNAKGHVASAPVKVAVQGIDKMPTAQTAKVGSDVKWEAKALVDAKGTQFDTKYEWQMQAGDKWITVPENGHFTGTNTDTLTVHGVTAADQGLAVRMVIRSKVFKLAGYDVIMVWSNGKATLNVEK